MSKAKDLLEKVEGAVEGAVEGVKDAVKGAVKDVEGAVEGAEEDVAEDVESREIHRLPLVHFFFRYLPAIPVDIPEALATLVRIGGRSVATQQAKQGLTRTFEIDGRTETAYTYMYGGSGGTEDANDSDTAERDEMHKHLSEHLEDDDDFLKTLAEVVETEPAKEAKAETAETPSTELSLESPDQYSMTWTTFTEIAKDAMPHLDTWASTLTDADQATEQFWPTIAEYGMAYHLLILQKIGAAQQSEARDYFGATWTDELTQLSNDGLLYGLDLRLFESVEPQKAGSLTRFTPSTWTRLRQDPQTKALTPIVVSVAGHEGTGRQDFVLGKATPSAWIYALFAAKTSVTVYGIWLGHVYQWHLVTAAMQMTMFNSFSSDHPIYQLLAPQSKYLFGFDNGLLAAWNAAGPPTSITSSIQFLSLCNTFGTDRSLFADDTPTGIANLGLDPADFTVDEGEGTQAWNRYPLVGQLVEVWDITEKYVDTFVKTYFPTDAKVQEDEDLQTWITSSGDPKNGNVQGLPRMDTAAALKKVLTSFLYRITVHGCSRQMHTSRTVLSFVPNYPPCLQSATIPSPDEDFSLKDLLSTLPATGTLGTMMTFYYTFAFSAPYEPFIPLAGVYENLFFPGGKEAPCNQALVEFRKGLISFIESYDKRSPQISQWPLNVET